MIPSAEKASPQYLHFDLDWPGFSTPNTLALDTDDGAGISAIHSEDTISGEYTPFADFFSSQFPAFSGLERQMIPILPH